jgi:hypothetical protein
LNKYDSLGNYDPAFLSNTAKARRVYFHAKNNPKTYPDYQKCIKASSTKWRIREYVITAMRLMYVVPLLIVTYPIEVLFGNNSSHFILDTMD